LEQNKDLAEIIVKKSLGFFKNSKLTIASNQKLLDFTNGKMSIPKNRDQINKKYPDLIIVWGDETVDEMVENIRKNENEAAGVFLLYWTCLNTAFPQKLKDVYSSLNKYPSIIKKLKPLINKMDPEMKKRLGVKSGGCFIATATMGSYNHPLVLDLREFRDTRLNKFKFGKYFIKIYYKLSPPISSLISKSILLRKVFYYILIKPVHLIIKKK
tara:strand:- start:77 stop:715 length:639 start_codon:yes stop_codon:yes gene_type:complete